jgi:hypothetical protein
VSPVGKKLNSFTEEEPAPVKIIWSIAAMHGPVMVRAQQDEIREPILTTTA